MANQGGKQWREISPLLLAYSGPKGESLIRSVKKPLKSKLPDNIVTKSAYWAVTLKPGFHPWD